MREDLFVSGARDPDGGWLLSLRVRAGGERTVVEACGEIDLGTAGLLARVADRVLEENPGRLVLDLARVTFFSAAGLRVLMELRGVAGERLVLRAPSPSVVFVLELTALADRFTVWDAETEPGRDDEPGGDPIRE